MYNKTNSNIYILNLTIENFIKITYMNKIIFYIHKPILSF